MAGTGAEISPFGSKRSPVAEHAQKLLTQAVESGQVAPDAAAAVAGATIPAFSAGTVALDPNTGRPASAPPPNDETAISRTAPVDPLSDDADAGAAQEAAAAGRAATPERERDASGKFVGDKPAEPKPPAAAPKPKTQTQRAAAAEDAAQAIIDEWEDLQFEHDDGSKYTVRAKKGEAKQIERFNRRQAQVDRHAAWMNKFRPVLEPLVTGGQLDAVLPVLQRAVQDQRFGEFVIQAYNRVAAGLPLEGGVPGTPAQQQVTPPPTPGAVAPAAVAAPPAISDPFIAEALAPVMPWIQGIQEQNAALQQKIAEWEGTQVAQSQRQQQEAAAAAERSSQLQAAHMDLARMYPARFTGNLQRDQREWDNVIRYARDGGYVDMPGYGLRGAVVAAAHQYIADRSETASPAAEIINEIDRTTLRAAQQQAAGARSISGGGAAPQATARSQRLVPQKPSTRDANGRIKPARQMMEETQAYAQQLAEAG